MKYRIVEENCFYTPQYKKFLFWEDFNQQKSFYGVEFDTTVIFSDLYGAKKFLDEKITKKNHKKPPPIIHPYP